MPIHIFCFPHTYITLEILANLQMRLQAASDWLYIYPKGLYDLILYTKKKYNDPVIYITENGN